jgi:hypothetical protein
LAVCTCARLPTQWEGGNCLLRACGGSPWRRRSRRR